MENLKDNLNTIHAALKSDRYTPNQEKQIELLITIVDIQTEMVNKQSELIEVIHKESKSSFKMSLIAIVISLLSIFLTNWEALLKFLTELSRSLSS